MKVISMKFIFILTIIALAAVFFWSEDKGPACYQVSDEQARTFAKNETLGQRCTTSWYRNPENYMGKD